MSDSTNYPDILGLITGGNRLNIGVAQVAVAARPRIVRAGRPFEMILLVQNASDGDIDVMMALHLPAQDAKRQHDRFITRTERLVVTVKGAEVGYIALPVSTLADTAISDGYKIGVEIEVKPLSKANRIRAAEGGGRVEAERLSEESKGKIEALKTASYVTNKHFGRNVIDVPITMMSGGVGVMTDFSPGWVSVSKVSDFGDDRLLLHYYGGVVQVNTLPKLKRSIMLEPLFEATKTRFAEAGAPLHDAEASAIARLMTIILEYATPRFNAHGNMAAGVYDVETLLVRDSFSFEKVPPLPHWFRAFLNILGRDERAASHVAQVIPRYLYDDLLRDAVDFGFALVDEATGEDLGSAGERETYREQVIKALDEKSGVDFSRIYLPLVMGAVLINDQMVVNKENPAELLREIGKAMEERKAETGSADEEIFAMTTQIIGRVGQRYGFYAGR